MTYPRESLICLQATPYYHVVSRCVRRAWLWGVDEYAGKDYSHRKDWVLERLRELSSVFAIDICAYAVLSNHYHLVLHVDAARARQWTQEDVVARWCRLFKRPVLIERWQQADCDEAVKAAAAAIVADWRQRLFDVSWYMRCLNEPLARRANAVEDRGHPCACLIGMTPPRDSAIFLIFLDARPNTEDMGVRDLPRSVAGAESASNVLSKFVPYEFVAPPTEGRSRTPTRFPGHSPKLKDVPSSAIWATIGTSKQLSVCVPAMTYPRESLICLQATPHYHVVSRCVRRAWLWGVDEYAGRDYSHRKDWVLERLRELSSVFAIDVCAYAVLSNHYHLVLHVDAARARQWTQEEVVARWCRLFRRPVLIERWQQSECDEAVRAAAEEIIADWRDRLFDVSWYMRCLNEPLARRANAEDECTGRFWEGALQVHEVGLLTAMAYVDLNPIRAGIATTPEECEFTSICARTQALRAESEPGMVPLLPFHAPASHVAPTIPFTLDFGRALGQLDHLRLHAKAARAVLDPETVGRRAAGSRQLSRLFRISSFVAHPVANRGRAPLQRAR